LGGFIQPIFFARSALSSTPFPARLDEPLIVIPTNWQSAVERTVTGLGYDLVDAEKGVGGLLRVMIDHPQPDRPQGDPPNASGDERFITVDDCEKVTRQLQHVLEVEGCAYERLEVSSPGLDRPLKKAADYARFVGEQVEVTLKLPFKGRKKFSGELRAEGDGWRLLLVANKKAVPKRAAAGAQAVTDAMTDQALDFSLDELRDARLVPVVDFKGRRFERQDARPADGIDGGRTQ
jgi:ribosome maturation factor RimP